MLEVSQVLECKQLSGQGVSIRKIARRLDLSRNTVRRYLRGAEPGVYQLDGPRTRPVCERIQPSVRQLLVQEQENETPAKQRMTAARVHRLLVGEGLLASARTVRTVFREIHRELRDPLERAYLPLSYEPGQDAQVDFMEAEVDDVVEGRVKRFVLIVRACYSRRAFRYVAPNQTREALFEGLMRAFEFFGGVFLFLWFDNLSPAVRKVLKGRKRELQRAFEAFQAHYGFKAEFCRPGRGNEKGGVENDVKWTRSELFTPIPRVDGRSGMQELADAFAAAELGRTVEGCDRSIGELWQVEQDRLLPLPPTRFEVAVPREATVSNRSWVQIATNFYSVPVHLVGEIVTVRVYAEEVVIRNRSGELARHARSYGSGTMTLDLEHYLPLLARKHRGLDRAVPVRQWLGNAPTCWSQLLVELRAREGEIDGSKHFVEALELIAHHGLEAMTRAVEAALCQGTVSLPMIRYHLGARAEEQRPELPVITYTGPSVTPGSAAIYQEVLCG